MNNQLPVSDVVDVTISLSKSNAGLRNFGATLILGSSNVIDTTERIREYSNITNVATDFGLDSDEYQAASLFFSQSPQPSLLYIGRWAKSDTQGLIKGKILSSDDQQLGKFTKISAGSFDITVDGSKVQVTGVDLQEASNLNNVASKVTTALQSKATCTWDGQRFTITSVSSGKTSTISAVSATELSNALGIANGATIINGISQESLTQAVSELTKSNKWYMCAVAADFDQDDAIEASTLIEASNPVRIIGFTSQDTNELDSQKDDTLGAKMKAQGFNRTMVMYSTTSKYAVASIMGRLATINYEGSNTMITMKFKDCPSLEAESLSSSSALDGKNVNVFVGYDNDDAIIQQGVMSGGYYIDERTSMDWLQNAMQTEVWSLFKTQKKIPQTDEGVAKVQAVMNSVLDRAVKNGMCAPGTWTGDDIGSLTTGDVLTKGYYVYFGSISEQSTADRAARLLPSAQVALKLAGAAHSVKIDIAVVE